MVDQDPTVLARLREVFAAELEDQLGHMAQQLDALTRSDASEQELHHAASELYRAVHSLKGASGAVGLREPEGICHRLEDRLNSAGMPQSVAQIAAVTDDIRRTLCQLERWQRPLEGSPETPRSAARNSAVESAFQGPTSAPKRLENVSAALAQQHAATIRVSVQALDELLVTSNDYVVHQRAPEDTDRIYEALAALDERLLESVAEVDRARLSSLVLGVRHAVERQTIEHKRWRATARAHGAELARRIRGLRLQAVADIAVGLESTIREAAVGEEKLVEFTFISSDAKADHHVVTRLREPLLQLVRNAVVHGIEPPDERLSLGKPKTGNVTVHVRSLGTELVISVNDDGRGIDIDALRAAAKEGGYSVGHVGSGTELLSLVCTPGLSTRPTPDTQAGRGIGMDLVRDRIKRLQGQIALHSEAGVGTRVEIHVPVDLSLLEVLVVTVGGGHCFALATSAVQAMMRLTQQSIVIVDGRTFARHQDELIPITTLTNTFDSTHQALDLEAPAPVVILSAGGKRAAVVVQQLVSVSDCIAKPLGERGSIPLASAAVYLEGGELAPLLSAQELCLLVAECNTTTLHNARPHKPTANVLVVDDSVTTRQLVSIILESAGYHVQTEADADSAWKRLREGMRLDAVITDIDMPGMSGFELLSHIRASARLRELPVILVSAIGEDHSRRRALDLGADAYVVKSGFDQQKLLAILEELIG